MKRILGIAVMVALAGATARADSINPWSGATASARVFEPSFPAREPQTGAVASESSSKSQVVRYEGVNYGSGATPVFEAAVTGSAHAEATGKADGLLVVGARYDTPNPGTRPMVLNPYSTSVSASAGWTGDRATIVAAPGTLVPETVRLNFQLGSAAPWFPSYDADTLTVSANGRAVAFTLDSLDTAVSHGNARLNDFFDQITLKYDDRYASREFHATFHIDLPVSAAGLSDPFSLSLLATPDHGLSSNHAIRSHLDGETLSLTSITTTDGTLLSDLGYGVTFDSGLVAPVPEPPSLAVAGLVVAAGLVARRRRAL